MKQVLIKKNNLLDSESFTDLVLRADKDLVLKPGANYVSVPWPVEQLDSSELRFFFVPEAGLATAGVALTAHYFETRFPKQVFLVLHNHNQTHVPLAVNSSLARASAYEPVQIRAVDQEFRDVMILTNSKSPAPKTKRPRKAPQKPRAPGAASSSGSEPQD